MERRISLLSNYATKMTSGCSFHTKDECRLVEHDICFVCYLQSLATQESVDDKSYDVGRLPQPVEDEYEDICENTKKEALARDRTSIKYGSIIIETHVSNRLKNNDLPIPCLSSFTFDGSKEYVFLHDI